MTGAVVIRRQNKLMRRFADAGATDPATAQPLVQLGARDSWIFRRMVARQIFRTNGDERYYMDTAAAELFVQHRRKRALLITVILLACFAFVLAILSLMKR